MSLPGTHAGSRGVLIMRFLFVMGAAFVAARIVLAADLPVAAPLSIPAVPGKGTIGLVCLDAAGTLHFWNAADKADFTSCVDDVVKTWTTKAEATSPASFDEMIEGMAAYRQTVDRVSAASASAPAPAPVK